jgi:hypothetical protein
VQNVQRVPLIEYPIALVKHFFLDPPFHSQDATDVHLQLCKEHPNKKNHLWLCGDNRYGNDYCLKKKVTLFSCRLDGG